MTRTRNIMVQRKLSCTLDHRGWLLEFSSYFQKKIDYILEEPKADKYVLGAFSRSLPIVNEKLDQYKIITTS